MTKRRPGGITELTKASAERLTDAKSLIGARRYRGAVYIAGYAVECILKTKLMQRFNCRNLDELDDKLRKRRQIGEDRSLFTHELILLVTLLDCIDRIQADRRIRKYFSHVSQWTPHWRYTAEPINAEKATDFIQAVAGLVQWISASV
ncbi:MAG TPA: hypothetical protein VGI40_01380 [Pirellulaceae bacterium]|jgi:hypothetical protein